MAVGKVKAHGTNIQPEEPSVFLQRVRLDAVLVARNAVSLFLSLTALSSGWPGLSKSHTPPHFTINQPGKSFSSLTEVFK